CGSVSGVDLGVHIDYPASLIFYHMDPYDTKERLEIFPEGPVGRGSKELSGNWKESGGTGEEAQSEEETELEKEVEELKELYGLDDYKEIEDELFAGIPARTSSGAVAMGSYGSAFNVPKSRSSAGEAERQTRTQSAEEQSVSAKLEGPRRPAMPDTLNIQLGSEEDDIIYCVTCNIPVRASDQPFGEHKDHEVNYLANEIEMAKDEINKNVCKLEDQIAQMENFASHLEEIFITVEENFGRQEQNFEMHYNDVVKTLGQRHDELVQTLGEEKKEKLEVLYRQLVSCGEDLDTCKELMDTIQDVSQAEEKVDFIKVFYCCRLEEFLKKEMDLELSVPADFEDKVIDFSDVQQLMDSVNTLPAPSAPVMNPQAPNSATGTSVRVCWGLFSDDTVESYQLYYKQVSDDTSGEERAGETLRVKETYSTVTNLAPNTQYEFWVSASNASGVSPTSERAVYATAPLPPIIKSKKSRSCESSALVCWESGNTNPVDSYTVELSRVASAEDEDIITESIVGIPNCEALIQLEPGEIYVISVRAVNVGGPSQKSKSISIQTTGTYFYLDEDTAHPLLSILEDGFTIACKGTDHPEGDLPFGDNSFTGCIAILGSQIPFRGKHYWEVETEEDTEYRTGVAFENTARNDYLGANSSSWCMRHIVTPSGHKYEFLHSGISPDIRITIPPRRIGILLDYDKGTLSFFNMNITQHLYTFQSHFQHFVHPCFALETPGFLKIHTSIAMPTFVTLL
uniref:Fibronectin type III and SPRY domain containing 2 n=1 Tax=Sphenodon punctatus TaxID=8508 RepID=A0A8D0L7R6_SPHPU